MTPFHSFRRPILAIGLCSFAFAGVSMAGDGPDPSHLPLCQPANEAAACRLPVTNGQFDVLDGWTRGGLPTIGYDESGNSYAALHFGAAISQTVYAHFGTPPQHAAYALRFRARADRGTGQLRATLSMSDDTGVHRLPLGETTTTARTGEWSTVELMVNGAAFAAPAHVLLEIANEGSDYVQVDDVHLVQAEGADVFRFY